MMEMKIQYRI